MINPNTRKQKVLQGEAREKIESGKAKTFEKEKKYIIDIPKWISCSCGRSPIPGEFVCYRCSE